ncbi:hypothetical protein Tco_1501863 [Tanacetum coccineum]
MSKFVPRSHMVLTIGKSNLLFNAQKIQKNPIFQISVDILKNTNFFQALTASANVPAIYLQQFLADMGRVYSRDPDIFLTQSKPQSQSEEPKEESNTSPHPVWTVFQRNLKFVPKGESVEVFGMAIPDPLITEAIRQSSYYPTYVKMVAENTKKTPQGSASLLLRPRNLPSVSDFTYLKVRKGKPCCPTLLTKKMKLKQESNPQREDDDPDLELAKKLKVGHLYEEVTIKDPVSETTPKLHEVVGKGKAVVTEEQVAHSLVDLSKKKRTTIGFCPARQVIQNPGAPKGDKVQGEIVSSTVTSGVSIPVSVPEKAHEALAGPDPEPMNEDQTGSDSGTLHVSLAGPNPEHMDDEFLATAYPKVHENLKLITDERVIHDKPESHSGSMSSMKNLDDTVNFGDQFLHDKPTEDDQEKSKAREESDSTIPDIKTIRPNFKHSSMIPPFTEVSSSKPSLLVTPPPINTEATTITTSLPEITPFIALYKSVKNQESEKSPKEIIKQRNSRRETRSKLLHQVQLMNGRRCIDKEVADKVKDHKRKHDSDDDDEDDDDDEGPSAGSNQGTKRRRSESAASGSSAKPPPKADDQSSKKPRESDPESEHSEQSSDDISMQDEGNVSDMEDTDNAHIPKVSTTTWFKPIPESERPATPEPEWTISTRMISQNQKSNGKCLPTSYKVPKENNFKEDRRKEFLSTNIVISDREAVKIADAILRSVPSQYSRKAQPSAQDRQDQSSHSSQHVDKKPADYYFKEDYTIVPKPRAVVYRDRNEQRKLMRLNELHKFSDGTLTRVMEKLDQMVKDFHLFEYNKGMES